MKGALQNNQHGFDIPAWLRRSRFEWMTYLERMTYISDALRLAGSVGVQTSYPYAWTGSLVGNRVKVQVKRLAGSVGVQMSWS